MVDYETRVREAFKRLKQPEDLPSANGDLIPLRCNRGVLIPVSELHIDDDVLIETLGQWAEKNNHIYPVQFEVTRESTTRWLKRNVLADPGRILFLIKDSNDNLVGHVGFIDCINEDQVMCLANLLRGNDGTGPGIMGQAVQSVLHWAYQTIHPKTISCRTLAGNRTAIAFFKKNGFVGSGYQQYWKENVGDRAALTNRDFDSSGQPDIEFLVMHHERKDGSDHTHTKKHSVSER